MNYLITIPGRLPNLNDYTKACRGRRGHILGALMKSESQNQIEEHIPEDIKDLKISGKVRLHYRWFEKNDRRDIDNISGFGHKVIQDALVNCQVIPDDNQHHIIGYTDDFYVDSKNPRIEIEIERITDE